MHISGDLPSRPFQERWRQLIGFAWTDSPFVSRTAMCIFLRSNSGPRESDEAEFPWSKYYERRPGPASIGFTLAICCKILSKGTGREVPSGD